MRISVHCEVGRWDTLLVVAIWIWMTLLSKWGQWRVLNSMYTTQELPGTSDLTSLRGVPNVGQSTAIGNCRSKTMLCLNTSTLWCAIWFCEQTWAMPLWLCIQSEHSQQRDGKVLNTITEGQSPEQGTMSIGQEEKNCECSCGYTSRGWCGLRNELQVLHSLGNWGSSSFTLLCCFIAFTGATFITERSDTHCIMIDTPERVVKLVSHERKVFMHFMATFTVAAAALQIFTCCNQGRLFVASFCILLRLGNWQLPKLNCTFPICFSFKQLPHTERPIAAEFIETEQLMCFRLPCYITFLPQHRQPEQFPWRWQSKSACVTLSLYTCGGLYPQDHWGTNKTTQLQTD